jgi:hypothetical protein
MLNLAHGILATARFGSRIGLEASCADNYGKIIATRRIFSYSFFFNSIHRLRHKQKHSNAHLHNQTEYSLPADTFVKLLSDHF